MEQTIIHFYFIFFHDLYLACIALKLFEVFVREMKSNDRKRNMFIASSEVERTKHLQIYKHSELWHRHNVRTLLNATTSIVSNEHSWV